MMADNEKWGIELLIISDLNIIEDKTLDLSEYIEKVFNYPLDKIKLSINDSDLTLPLSYVFSDLLDDFLLIVNDLYLNYVGNGTYGFSQNEHFDCDWNIVWDNDSLEINFLWRSIGTDFDIQIMPKKINISKAYFLKSWQDTFNDLLKFVNSDMIEDTTEYDFLIGFNNRTDSECK